jgi:hypothetical protein
MDHSIRFFYAPAGFHDVGIGKLKILGIRFTITAWKTERQSVYNVRDYGGSN